MSGSASIDGRSVVPAPGESVLAAARRLGIQIPALCQLDGARPEGGCRLCLVEIAGRDEPLAACHTPLSDDMRITTRTPRLHALRRELLGLLVEERAPALRADPAGSEVERLMHELGVPGRGERSFPDRSHPLLHVDAERCVLCRRCVHVCADVQGAFVWNVVGHGGEAHLEFGARRFAESACVACGACVDVCPSGAIGDRDRTSAPAPEQRTRSTCGYCGVGCQVEVGTAEGRVVRIDGVREASVNRGHLCAKGRYAHGWQRSSDRLTRPLLRRGGRLEPVSWDAALGYVAERLDAIHRAHGPDALGALTSSRSTNEAAYLLQKLFRVRFGTNHVDCCARVCHASTAHALRAVTGTGAATAAYADIEQARAIVVAGANPTEAHPVLGARIFQRVRAGARLFVIDPRKTELAGLAHHHLALRPGSNVALLNALAKVLVDERLVDRPYVAERCEGFDALASHLRRALARRGGAHRGRRVPALRAFARELASSGPALYVMGLGLSELTQGVASVRALANLALLTGAIGPPGAGLLPLRGQNNVQGNADMGAMPDALTGYQPVADPAVRARFASLWGAEPPEPARPHAARAARRGGARRAARALGAGRGPRAERSEPDARGRGARTTRAARRAGAVPDRHRAPRARRASPPRACSSSPAPSPTPSAACSACAPRCRRRARRVPTGRSSRPPRRRSACPGATRIPPTCSTRSRARRPRCSAGSARAASTVTVSSGPARAPTTPARSAFTSSASCAGARSSPWCPTPRARRRTCRASRSPSSRAACATSTTSAR